MEDLLTAIFNYGFPAALAVYLLLRFEAKIDRLTEVMTGLSTQIQMMRNDLNKEIAKD